MSDENKQTLSANVEAKLEGQWHKLLAAVMAKFNINEVALSLEDCATITSSYLLVTEGKNGDGLLHIELRKQS